MKTCKKTIIHYCIEQNCNNTVSKKGNKCWVCESARRRKPKKIYYCINSNCKNKVYKEGNKCRSCSHKGNQSNYKHGNYCRDKIHYCIESDCHKEVSKENGRCRYHAQIVRYLDPKQRQTGKRASGYKHGYCCKDRIYYCIEPNCNKKVSGFNKRCNHCAKILENNPNWQGGKSFEIYPLGWDRTFKEQIRFRDKYKCQLCGTHEVECNRKLHVHHIDYNKQNINSNNLISLCARCHAKTNDNREYWKEYCKEKITQCQSR
jgi:hypothetical protein